jgi:hypothetical protein
MQAEKAFIWLEHGVSEADTGAPAAAGSAYPPPPPPIIEPTAARAIEVPVPHAMPCATIPMSPPPMPPMPDCCCVAGGGAPPAVRGGGARGRGAAGKATRKGEGGRVREGLAEAGRVTADACLDLSRRGGKGVRRARSAACVPGLRPPPPPPPRRPILSELVSSREPRADNCGHRRARGVRHDRRSPTKEKNPGRRQPKNDDNRPA